VHGLPGQLQRSGWHYRRFRMRLQVSEIFFFSRWSILSSPGLIRIYLLHLLSNGYTKVNGVCVLSASQRARSRRAAMILERRRVSKCPANETACPLGLFGNYECIDVSLGSFEA
jgi:hypothetical protein